MLLRIVLIILVIIWCVVIFVFSNMTGTKSNGKSKKFISKTLNKATHYKLKIRTLENLNTFLRKCVHASEFCILGILIFVCLRAFEIHNWQLSVISILISFLYACSDELHQKFVDGRHCKFTDVLIDTVGAIIGIIIINIIAKTVYKIKERKREKNECSIH